MNAPVKHFLDLSEIPAKELRRMIELARTFKKSRRSLIAKKPLEAARSR